MENLIEGLQRQMNRVREIIKEYEHPALNGAGTLAATLMKLDIDKAEKAIATGDTIQMMVCYTTLESYES